MSSNDTPASADDAGFDALADLLDVLDLRAQGDDTYVGRSQPQPHGRVFGGQVLAQSLVAAGRTVEPPSPDGVADRHVHSMHAYFLRAGDAARPVRFVVERLRDGRSFSARRVLAFQDDAPILALSASFQTTDPGPAHQDEMPQVTPPEDLPPVAELLSPVPDTPAKLALSRRAIDVRHVEPPLYLQPATERVARQHVWITAAGRLPDDPLLHAAVAAYASDYTLLESVLRVNGIAWVDPALRAASLDHSMWFHRPLRADDWLLYAQASPSSQGGRGLGIGRMFARDGTLVASVAQEGMVRLKER